MQTPPRPRPSRPCLFYDEAARRSCGTPTRDPSGRCELHAAEWRQKDNARRAARRKAHNRRHPNWTKLQAQAPLRSHGICEDCGTNEATTLHLRPEYGTTDHSTATLEMVEHLCRPCHGRRDGQRSNQGQPRDLLPRDEDGDPIIHFA